ncbi:GNAT family N-acetyltransferase [Macrococcus sp. EM39E]|uniref:GNAT family N-acetyltransferase n=1 Tax=Macrococcus animalis TaxID=3395467 RepID=UPI0039BFF768
MYEFRKLTLNDEDLFNDYFKAWGDEQESIVPSATNIKRYNSFQDFINNLEEREKSYEVLNSTLFLIEDGSIVGASNIRHYLNEFLIHYGGHIGYGVRPDKRGKGYATIILRESLNFLNSLNVEKALITCDEDNITSKKVILNNGGIQDQSHIREDGGVTNRFWIDL